MTPRNRRAPLLTPSYSQNGLQPSFSGSTSRSVETSCSISSVHHQQQAQLPRGGLLLPTPLNADHTLQTTQKRRSTLQSATSSTAPTTPTSHHHHQQQQRSQSLPEETYPSYHYSTGNADDEGGDRPRGGLLKPLPAYTAVPVGAEDHFRNARLWKRSWSGRERDDRKEQSRKTSVKRSAGARGDTSSAPTAHHHSTSTGRGRDDDEEEQRGPRRRKEQQQQQTEYAASYHDHNSSEVSWEGRGADWSRRALQLRVPRPLGQEQTRAEHRRRHVTTSYSSSLSRSTASFRSSISGSSAHREPQQQESSLHVQPTTSTTTHREPKFCTTMFSGLSAVALPTDLFIGCEEAAASAAEAEERRMLRGISARVAPQSSGQQQQQQQQQQQPITDPLLPRSTPPAPLTATGSALFSLSLSSSLPATAPPSSHFCFRPRWCLIGATRYALQGMVRVMVVNRQQQEGLSATTTATATPSSSSSSSSSTIKWTLSLQPQGGGAVGSSAASSPGLPTQSFVWRMEAVRDVFSNTLQLQDGEAREAYHAVTLRAAPPTRPQQVTFGFAAAREAQQLRVLLAKECAAMRSS